MTFRLKKFTYDNKEKKMRNRNLIKTTISVLEAINKKGALDEIEVIKDVRAQNQRIYLKPGCSIEDFLDALVMEGDLEKDKEVYKITSQGKCQLAKLKKRINEAIKKTQSVLI